MSTSWPDTVDAPFSTREYRSRQGRLGRLMSDRGLDVLVVWQRGGGSYDRAGAVFWLCNYASMASGQEAVFASGAIGRGYAALLLVAGAEPELHISEPIEATDTDQIAVGTVHSHTGNLPAGVAARLVELGVSGRVGYFGDDFLPTQFMRHLSEGAPQIAWEPHEDIVNAIQRVKSAEELRAFRAAGAVASDALTAMMWGLIEGEPESSAAAKAAEIITRAGGGFQRLSTNHGDSPSIWSHGLYSHRPIAARPGELVRGWVMGPILHGLWLDPGRSAVCGNAPSPRQRDLIENTAALMDTALASVRPGATPRQIGASIDEAIAGLGLSGDDGPAIWSIYGHSLGSFFMPPYVPAGMSPSDEAPARMRAEEVVDVDMVFTIEMFLTDPEVGTATYEDCIIVGADGNELLTTTPKTFW